MNHDIAQTLAERIRDAHARREALSIRGSGSKAFLTGQTRGEPLEVTDHRGIVNYEPTELVLTARAGTPLAEIENALAGKNQMLAFEPPHFEPGATLGGTIACNLSGPRRPWTGSARDFVLGATMINGKGEILKFGGEVMKNVAGYDVSRLMAGAQGSLGVLLQVSLKVLPRPSQEITLTFDMSADQAIETMNRWAGKPHPISAACHGGNTLHLRLSGTDTALRSAHARLGGDLDPRGSTYWDDLREQRRAFFQDQTPVWRLLLPPATPMLHLSGQWLLDWGGAQRWLKSNESADHIARRANAAGGIAVPWRGLPPGHAEPKNIQSLRAALKQAFDPAGILNVRTLPTH